MAAPKDPGVVTAVPKGPTQRGGRKLGGKKMTLQDMMLIVKRLNEGWTMEAIGAELGRAEGTIRGFQQRVGLKGGQIEVKPGVFVKRIVVPADLQQRFDDLRAEEREAARLKKSLEAVATEKMGNLDTLDGVLHEIKKIAVDPTAHPPSQTQALRLLVEYHERRDPPQIRGTVEMLTRVLDRATAAQKAALVAKGEWTPEMDAPEED